VPTAATTTKGGTRHSLSGIAHRPLPASGRRQVPNRASPLRRREPRPVPRSTGKKSQRASIGSQRHTGRRRTRPNLGSQLHHHRPIKPAPTMNVGHDPFDGDPPGREPGHGSGQEPERCRGGLVGEDFDIGEPGGVIDTDMDRLPADLVVVVAGPRPVTRCPGLVIRPSFLTSMWTSRPGGVGNSGSGAPGAQAGTAGSGPGGPGWRRRWRWPGPARQRSGCW
jgi:hypothetical protein